ncbi:MAG: AAA family ATPase, partial [Leptospiraceae bacterium]|nr:AAA family ATPase [Leptospiraceae bacterium]
EEYKKNTPYSGFKEAISEFAKYVISLDAVDIETWKSRILKAIGRNGKVLIEVFPELEWIIGEQPDPPIVDALEAHNRFNTSFQEFLKVICSFNKPVVLFLDDLHWADDSSLYLLFQIMTDVEISNIMVIINWKAHEVHESDPIKVTLEIIKKGRAPVIEYTLPPIKLEDTESILMDSLNLEAGKVGELAEIIHRKTEGNPFFITEFLKTIYEEQIVYFDFRKRTWVWDITKIKTHKLSESIVEIVINKLNKLPSETTEILSLCSFFGNQFELFELTNLTGKDFFDIIQILWKPMEEGLIEPLDNNYKLLRLYAGLEKANSYFKFQHERIRMVAYNRIPEEERVNIHLKIARSISLRTPIYKIDEKIFEIVNHYNFALKKLTDQYEKLKLVEYNILAGKKALFSNSHGLAIKYFEAGIYCLPEDSWTSHMEVTMELMKYRAEAEFLNGNYQTSLSIIDEILKHSNNLLDRLDAKTLLLTQYNIVGRYEEALSVGKEALELLNIELPSSDYEEKTKIQLSEIKDQRRNKKISNLINYKPMDDREIQAAMKILSRVKSTTYLYKMELYPWIVTKMVNLSLKYGNSPESCFAYATYGIILGTQLDNYLDSYEFGWLGYRLSDRINNKTQKCKSGYILANYISPWKDSLKDSIGINDESYKAGIEAGELQFAGYAYAFKLVTQINCGFRVQDVMMEIRNCITFGKKTQNNWISDLLNGIYLVVSNLSKNNPDPANYSVENLTEEVFLRESKNNSSASAICVFYIMKAYALYLYELPEESLNFLEKAKDMLPSILGQFETALFVFYHSLLLCELYPRVSNNDQINYLEALRKNQQKLELWAKNCPQNFWVMYSLVEVEVQRITLLKENLIETYESIIEKTKEYGFPNLEAIANKLTFRYMLQKGN